MYSVAVRTAARRVAVAPISRSVVVGKRFTSTVHENDPKVRCGSSRRRVGAILTRLFQVIELEKQRNLRNEQHKTSTPIKNAPGWNQYLASDSEADVKVGSIFGFAKAPSLTETRRRIVLRPVWKSLLPKLSNISTNVTIRQKSTSTPSLRRTSGSVSHCSHHTCHTDWCAQADHSAATIQDLANGNAQRVHSEERLDAYEASYERDETSGPLKKKGSTKGSA